VSIIIQDASEIPELEEPIPKITQVVSRKHVLTAIIHAMDQRLKKLHQINIRNTQQLLNEGATMEGIEKIHKTTGLPKNQIYKWVSYANLMRIYGIDKDTAEQLFEMGVDSVELLSQWEASKLVYDIKMINEGRKDHKVPTEAMAQRWVRVAKTLYLKKILQDIFHIQDN
jgi:hypothetical protein